MNNGENIYSDVITNNQEQQTNTTPETFMKSFDYENVAITDIVNIVILDSIDKKASDIHFNPTEDGIVVRIRIDGELRNYTKVPIYVKKNISSRSGDIS